MSFTIGETIRVTFQTFGQRWFRFTATTVLAFVAIAAVFGIFGYSLLADDGELLRLPSMTDPRPVAGTLWVFIVGVLLISIAIYAFLELMILEGARSQRTTGQLSLAGCFGKALGAWLPAFVLLLILIVIFILSFFLSAIPAGIIGTIGGGVATFILVILSVIPALLFLSAIFFVAMPALLFEKVGIFGALARSASLTKGHRWRLVGLTVIYYVLSFVASAVTEALGLIGDLTVISEIINLAAQVFLTTIGFIGTYVSYEHIWAELTGPDAPTVAAFSAPVG